MAPWPRHLWQALKPGLWLAVGVALMWGWRLTGWLARQAFDLIEIQPREISKGLAWDLALVACLFAVGRVAALHRAAHRPPVHRLAGRLIGGGVLLLGVVAVVVRGLDAGHCLLGGSHWTSQAFMYLDRGFSGTLMQARTLGALATLAGTALLLAWALWRDGQQVARRLAPALANTSDLPLAWRRWIAWSALLLTALPAAWALKDGIRYPAHVHHWRLVPEVNFVSRWLQSRSAPDPATTAAVPEATWSQFIAAGLVPPLSRPDDPFPLLRATLAEPPFPHPLRAGVSADLRPNVVITFMESVNSLFVHELSGRYRGLMPEVSALARRMSRVDGFHNTSSPTIAAMVAALCSVHPASHPYDLAVCESVDGRTAYT